MSSRTQGRHRAAVRPKTPLTSLADSMSASAGTVGRRTAVIAASSGLVVSMGVTAADAAPVSDQPAPAAPTAKSAEQLPVEAAALTVPADVQNTQVGAVTAAVIAPPPPPPPPVVQAPAVTRAPAARASRSATRTAPATAAEPVAAPAGDMSATRANIMAIAARYVGISYRYGGTTPSGFDCSGYTGYVFAQVGISLPRTSGAQASAGRRISSAEALPGDLVYKPGHIGIYAGDGMMYDSPRTGSSVSKRAMWSSDFVYIRVLND